MEGPPDTVAISGEAEGFAGSKLAVLTPAGLSELASVNTTGEPPPLLNVKVTDPGCAVTGKIKDIFNGDPIVALVMGDISVGIGVCAFCRICEADSHKQTDNAQA